MTETQRPLTKIQADLLERFCPADFGKMKASAVKLEYINFEPSRRPSKRWWPSMDWAVKRGLLCIRKTTTETLMGDGEFFKDQHWQAATSWKGIELVVDYIKNRALPDKEGMR